MTAAYRRLAAVGLAIGVGAAAADPPFATPVRPAFKPAEQLVGGFGLPPDLDVPIRATAATDPRLRPEPAVSLDWTGPAVVRLGKPTAYTLTVKNTSASFVQKVTVQVRPPHGATVTDTKPAARVVDGVHLWDVGTLEPGEAKPLGVTLTGGRAGDMACQAWVTFTGTAGMTVKVQEPKLFASIDAPAKVNVGDEFTVGYKLANTGDCRVEVRDMKMSHHGLKFESIAADTTVPRMSLGGIDPGLTTGARTRYLAEKAGTFTLSLVAVGDDGVQASVTQTVQVVGPALTVGVTGPDKLLVGRTGKYTLTVRNTGELAVDDVAPTVPVPAGLRVAAADSGRLNFPVGKLAPGEVREVTFDAVAATPGLQTVLATVTGSRGATAAAECRTVVDGVPALRCELMDLADPVEKGQDTTYEVRLVNTGTKADETVRLVCELPAGIGFKSAAGPTGHQHVAGIREGGPSGVNSPDVLTFDPIRELAPKTEAVFRVKVTAVAAGDVRFKAVVTSKHLTGPVVKEESTRVYGD